MQQNNKKVSEYIRGRRDFTTIDISVALKMPPSAVRQALSDLGFYLKRFQRGAECFERWVPAPAMGRAA